MGAKAPCLGWLVGGRVEILMCYTCGCVQKEVWISDLELRIQAIIETLNLGVLNILVRTCMPRSEYGVERACVLYPQPPCTLCTVVTRLIIVQLSAEGSAVSLSSTLKVRPFHFFFFLFFLIFIRLHRVLVAPHSIFDLRHVGSSSLTRGQTWASCIGGVASIGPPGKS